MTVLNELETDSFKYTRDKPNMRVRSDEIIQLSEIYDYISEIKETITIDEKLYSIEVEETITFIDWLFSTFDTDMKDEKDFLIQFCSKQMSDTDNSDKVSKTITISLGKYKDNISTCKEYVNKRRDILKDINSAEEYYEFMSSCFINSIFADNILSEMKKICDFKQHNKEITNNLSVLNDEALDLYRNNRNNIKNAISILTNKLLECSLDPNHKDKLRFKFTYIVENEKGESEDRSEIIECQPHLKLIRRDSDLRIYFFWCDDKVGKGEKVLIGRIGSHPYLK